MGGLSIWHWLFAGLIALLLFGGRGQISNIMGDAAKGIKAFKDGLKDEPEDKKTKVEDEPKAPSVKAPVAEETVAAGDKTTKVG